MRIRTKIIKTVCFANSYRACVCLCVCVVLCVCVCTCSTCREQIRLQIMGFSSSTHSLGFGGFFISPLSTLTSTFVQHLCHSVLSLAPSTSLSHFFLFPSLSHLSPPSHMYSVFRHNHPCPQEPQTTVIHNPVDGTKVHQRPAPTRPVSSLPYSAFPL